MTDKILRGTVRGNTIELEEAHGFAEGQQVDVVVTIIGPPHRWGEGIRRSAGAAASVPEFDDVFAQIEEERRSASYRERAS